MYTTVINLAYVLMLCAFLTREVLVMRLLLVGGQTLIALYAWHTRVVSIATWNVVFLVINVTMSLQILRERRAVTLADELRDLHSRHFAALTPTEFLRWWQQGRREQLADVALTREGERPEWLYFLLDGTVHVSRNGARVVELSRGQFVAEMSLLTGRPATADAHARQAIEVVRWPTRELRDLQARNPALWAKIQSVIGHDLVEKIRHQEAAGV